MSELVGKR